MGREARFCANPVDPAAMAGCCHDMDDARSLTQERTTIACEYRDERVTFATAQGRCRLRNNATLCTGAAQYSAPADRWWHVGTPNGPGQAGYHAAAGGGGCWNERRNTFLWRDEGCSIAVQVGVDSMVSIVHPGGESEATVRFAYNRLPDILPDSQEWFRVRWDNGSFPLASANCTNSADCKPAASRTPPLSGASSTDAAFAMRSHRRRA